MEKDLGLKIKALRNKRKMTLKEISNKTGLSISFISQLEHSKTSATLESFKKISEALGVSPSYFFSITEGSSKSIITRSDDHDKSLKRTKFIYSDLTGNMENPLFIPNLIILNPGDNRGSNFTHQGQEFLFVLEGVLTILLNNEEYTLFSYDSVFLDASTPHYWLNKTDDAIKFLCISSTK